MNSSITAQKRKGTPSVRKAAARSLAPHIEPLESRIAPAFAVTLAGTVASFVGSAATETLAITESGGLLQHNRFTAGDAGFSSNFDFDSTQAGDQTLAVAAVSIVNVNGGGGGDTFTENRSTAFDTGTLDLTGGTVAITAGGALTQATGTITTADLAIHASSTVSLLNANDVTNHLAIQGGGQNVAFNDANSIRLGTVDGIVGVQTGAGSVSLSTTAGDFLTNNTLITTTSGGISVSVGGLDSIFANGSGVLATSTGPITITADRMNLGSQANGLRSTGGGNITLAPATAGRTIDFGSSFTLDPNGTLSLSSAELSTLNTSGLVTIGTAAAGAITFNAGIDASPITSLALVTGATIGGAGTLTETNLALTAATGIGLAGTPLKTAASNLEAGTATGGIFIDNTGDLAIGGVTSSLLGVRVTGASGDIVLNNAGSISIITNGQIVKGPGNVSVIATGATSDLLTGGGNTLATGAIVSGFSSTLTVQAGRDILVGNPPGGAGNRVGDLQGGSVVISAGRHVVVDAFSYVDAHGTGTLSATAGTAGAGGDISILQTGVTGSRISTEGGTLTLTTGAAGKLIVDSETGGGTIRSNMSGGNGNIVINADRLDLTSGDSIAAGSGTVTIQQVSAGQAIDLGSTTDVAAGTLEISDAELDRISTTGGVRIGSLTNTGGINVTQAISAPATFTTLHLRSGGNILDTGAGSLGVPNLAVEGNGVNLDSATNNVTTLAGRATGSFVNAFIFVNSASLSVGSADGIDGLATTSGGLSLNVNGTLTVTSTPAAQDIDSAGTVSLTANTFVNSASAVVASNNNALTIAANAMTLTTGSSINSGTARTTLTPKTANTQIDLGGADAAGVLGLTDAELATVTAGSLTIGGFGMNASGSLQISSAITRHAGYSTLELTSNGAITQTAPLAVANLFLGSNGGITLNTPGNDVDVLAGAAGVGTTFSYTDSNDLTVGTVASKMGILTERSITLVTGGALTVNQTIQSINFGITLTATDTAGAGNDIIFGSEGKILAPDNVNGAATLQAGDNITIDAGAVLDVANALSITGDFGNADAGTGSTISIAGSINGSTITITGNADNDAITLGGGAVKTKVGRTVTVDGAGGSNTLTVDDTAATAGATVTITPTGATAGTIGAALGDSFFSTGVSLTYSNIDDATLNLGDGADTIELNPSTGTTFTVDGGDPTVNPGDTLHYLKTGGILPSGPGAGTITSTGVQTVTFSDIEVASVLGFTITPTPAGLVVSVSGDQDFINEDDTFAITTDVTGQFLSVALNGNVGFYADQAAVAQLNLSGLGGNDTLSVDSSGGLIDVANGIRYDGGTGFNGLQLAQAGGDTQASDTFSVGPNAGDVRSVIVGPSGTQSIFAQNLAPVLDLVPSALLTVNGTAATNAIDYSAGTTAANGKVTVDDFESIEFSNKAALTIDAGAGSDSVNLDNPSTPNGLTDITVIGGNSAGDVLTINGTAGPDVIFSTAPASDAGDVTVVGGPALHYTTTESVILNGFGGDDVFALCGVAGNVSVFGGLGSDTIDFSAALAGVIFNLDAVGVHQTVSASGSIVTLGDVVENFTGSAFNDILSVSAAPFTRTLDGGIQTSTPPGDRLVFDGRGSVVQVQKIDANTGTIKTAGFVDVFFDDFETTGLINTPSGNGGFGNPGLAGSSTAFGSAHVYDPTTFSPLGKPLGAKGTAAVETGDLNGDGFADMVVVNSASKNITVFLNQGDGSFGEPTAFKVGSTPRDLVLGDFNADGDLDAAVSNRGSKDVSILLGTGTGTFGAATSVKTKAAPFAIAKGDLNGDGNDDLVVTFPTAHAIGLLIGTGTGGFAAPVQTKVGGKQPVDVVVADFNGDGDLDVATANNTSNNVSLLRGNGAGVFAAPSVFATGQKPTGLSAGDIDGDGRLDLAVSHSVSRFVSVLYGNGNTLPAVQFQPQLRVALAGSHAATSIVIADFTGDGLADIGLSNSVNTTFTVVLSTGVKTFSAPYEFDLGKSPLTQRSGGIAVADLNNDGLLDVLATSPLSSDVRVLLRNV